MNSEFLNSSFIFTYPLKVTAQNVIDIVEKAPEPAGLKDAQTGKYILLNKYEPIFSGLPPEDVIGLTVDNLDPHVGLLNGLKPAYVKNIKEMDRKVINDKSPVLFHEVLVTYYGFIRIQSVIKIPIFGHNNKVIAILAYDQDLTPRFNLFDLLSMYEKGFSLRGAITQFLRYFKVDVYFQKMPTRAETLVILAMSLDNRHKKVAELLKITPKTAACHIAALRQKLKKNADLYTILSQIRNASRNTHLIEDRAISQPV